MSLIGRFLSAHEFRTEAYRVSSIVVWTGSLVVFLFYFLAFLQIQNSLYLLSCNNITIFASVPNLDTPWLERLQPLHYGSNQ